MFARDDLPVLLLESFVGAIVAFEGCVPEGGADLVTLSPSVNRPTRKERHKQLTHWPVCK